MRGASADRVRAALDDRDSLPGTCGFAGSLDGALVRDVLGREPLFVDDVAGPPFDEHAWGFDLRGFESPAAVPAGSRLDLETGDQERILSLPSPAPTDDETAAVDDVRSALRTSVDAIDTTGLAIAFSGGVDSSILASRLDAPLYVAGFPESHDVDAARSGARLLDREVRVVEVTHDDLRRAVPEIVAATGRTNAMDVQIALPLYLVAERIAADGYDRIALGQCADELFGGYAKVAKAPDDPRVDADTVRSARDEVVATVPEQLERDVLALRTAGVEPVVPFGCDTVVEAALRLPADMLVAGETRKVALREVASEWLPDDLVTREKKAAQYGSLVARELDRLARQAGFKRRMDDHVTRYVESLVTE